MTPDEIALDQDWASTEAREILCPILKATPDHPYVPMVADALRAAKEEGRAEGYAAAREQAAKLADPVADCNCPDCTVCAEIAEDIREMEPEG